MNQQAFRLIWTSWMLASQSKFCRWKSEFLISFNDKITIAIFNGTLGACVREFARMLPYEMEYWKINIYFYTF